MSRDENDKGIAMEVRKIKILPEDEHRLRELLKIHETDIERLSDEELTAVEDQMSLRLRDLLHKHQKSPHNQPVLRLRRPLKAGAVAFLAAAAVLLFMQMQFQESIPHVSELVTKGNEPATRISCDSTVVESDGTSPDIQDGQYLIPSGKSSYVKLHCGQPVYVHVGYLRADMLHLELSNLAVSMKDKVVMQGIDRVDFTALAKQNSGLVVLVTDKPLDKLDLTPKDRAGLWFEELPLLIK
jgi:hypothetical protein